MAKIFSQTGLRHFRDLKTGERFSRWSESAAADPILKTLLVLIIIPLLVTTAYTFWHFSGLPDEVPLFYSRSWGEAQLASKNYLFLPLLGGLIFSLVNVSLGVSFHNREKILTYFLIITAVLVSFLAATTVFNIVNLMSY